MIIPYGRQTITDEDIQEVIKVLRSDYLTQGPSVELFEKKICEAVRSKNAVAVTNGTAALHLAAMSLGVRPGQKVLVATNTFVASANCILYCGADVELVDIDPETLCISYEKIKEKLESKPSGYYSGIVAVDFAGFPLNFEKLRLLADKHKLWIIEDACHAVGAWFENAQGERVYSGSSQYADISVYSFHPVKHIATGEGGAVTTRTKELDERVRLLRTHGITKNPSDFMKANEGPWYYEMQALGYNYRISDILCALGASQLKRLSANLDRRNAIATVYDQELAGLSIELPQKPKQGRHAYHLYVIQTENREKLVSHLRSKNIFPQVHYIPVHKQPYYEQKYGRQTLSASENYYSKALSIPMYHGMTDQDQEQVIAAIKSFY